jgi:hypothetical protein
MKHLCSFILAVFLAISSHAAQPEFLLNITADDVIIHNQNDWYFVAKRNAFVPYHEPYYMYGVDVPARALYVYGSLHCGKQKLMLLMDLYVDATNKVIFRNSYEVNSHIVSLNVPNTTRFDILNLVCKESI